MRSIYYNLCHPENDVICVLGRETSKGVLVDISNLKPGDKTEDNLEDEWKEDKTVCVDNNENNYRTKRN